MQEYTENFSSIACWLDSRGNLVVVLGPEDEEEERGDEHRSEGDTEEGHVDVALGGRDVDAGPTARGPSASGWGATTAS